MFWEIHQTQTMQDIQLVRIIPSSMIEFSRARQWRSERLTGIPSAGFNMVAYWHHLALVAAGQLVPRCTDRE